MSELKAKLKAAEERFSRLENESLPQGATGGVIMGGAGGDNANIAFEPKFKTAQRDVNQLRNLLYGQEMASESSGGDSEGDEASLSSDIKAVGKVGLLRQLKNFDFHLPVDTGRMQSKRIEEAREGLLDRIKEISVKIDKLEKPTFDELAFNDLQDNVSATIADDTRQFLQASAMQEFEKAKFCEFTSIHTLHYIPVQNKQKLSVKNLDDSKTIQNAEFVRIDSDGSLIYHTDELVIEIDSPRFGQADERNMKIWQKAPHEVGKRFFTVPQSNPSMKGIYLTSRPDNEAARVNDYYGGVVEKSDLLDGKSLIQKFDGNLSAANDLNYALTA